MAGYSGTPLVRKLGIREGMMVATIDPPDHYRELLAGLPEDITFVDATTNALDVVHFFVRQQSDIQPRLSRLRATIAQDGMIWISWPKKASGVPTDVTGDVVRQAGLAAGLVDVKVCAVDEVWSGLKFVVRKADRR